jgi:hypothetical protein
MLMHRIIVPAILFLATRLTSAEAQFCYPGGCSSHGAPFAHRPYPFWHNSMRFAHGPTPSANRRPSHGYGYVPGGLSNPYTASTPLNGNQRQNLGGGQVATPSATGGHYHRYVPGGLSNPYTTSASVVGEQGQSSNAGSQRYSGGGGNSIGQGGYTGNNTSGGGYDRGDGQRVGDTGGQPGNGGYSEANGGAASNFRYNCTINDSEEDAGAACTRTSSALKHRGDRCSCHGEWGTVD